jgi:hypothetical protein
MSLEFVLIVDLLIVTACAFVLARQPNLRLFHPGMVYLLFHTVVFSYRGWAVLVGAHTLFSNWQAPGIVPIRIEEIAYALFTADFGLVGMTIGMVAAGRVIQKEDHFPPPNAHPISARAVHWVSGIAIPVGIFGLIAAGAVPQLVAYRLEAGIWEASSWPMAIMSWTGLGLLILVYWYGFRLRLMVPLAAYLMIIGLQGYHRFRLIIPVLFLIEIYLDRKRRRWPPLWMAAGTAAMILVFFPLKTIGQLSQQEFTRTTDIVDAAVNEMGLALSGRADDQMILDEYATVISLVDDFGHHYWGTTYWPLLVLPVPRAWWPDKPSLAQYELDISTPMRPIAQSGMVSTIFGESYANFGIFGVFAVPLILMYYLTRMYAKAYLYTYASVYRFTYIVIACNLIQVFRDGLISLVVFTVVNMMPLVAVIVLSLLWNRRRAVTPGFAAARIVSR